MKKTLKTAMYAALLTMTCAASTQAAITITPTLVVIEGRVRYADVNLVNTGDNVGSYDVGWKFYKMEDGTGSYIHTDKATTDFDLTQNIVFTPKRVTIGPKQPQKIRLGLRLKGEPPAPGDYRAHLLLKEAPKGTSRQESPTGRGAKIGVNVNVGFSIPVVYRVGESDATVQIGDVRTQINKKSGRIEAVVPTIKSQSSYGILGRLEIYYNNDLVGQVKNANIFTEARKRTYTVPLRLEKLSGGTLRIVYKDFHKEKDVILAEKTVPIGK